MGSFITELEDSMEVVADWVVSMVKDVTSAITEGGRPFDTVELSTEEQIQEYLTYRHQPDKWFEWINQRATTIIQKLTENGVDKVGVESIHPFDIALKLAFQYSIDMENKMRPKNGD